jgi:hypothetical protein
VVLVYRAHSPSCASFSPPVSTQEEHPERERERVSSHPTIDVTRFSRSVRKSSSLESGPLPKSSACTSLKSDIPADGKATCGSGKSIDAHHRPLRPLLLKPRPLRLLLLLAPFVCTSLSLYKPLSLYVELGLSKGSSKPREPSTTTLLPPGRDSLRRARGSVGADG